MEESCAQISGWCLSVDGNYSGRVTMPDLTWVDVEPIPHVNGDIQSVLDSVESLKSAWETVVAQNTEAFREARRRGLRRHAIETGIVERLYDVDWGVTEALVAEGLTAEAVARASTGSLDDDVLEVIRSQYDALEFLSEVARQGRPLTVNLIKQLHVALTRTQATYTATAPTGQRFEATLHHGEWKEQSNHVTRPDGSRLEYTPADQVQPQMEKLVRIYSEMSDYHPVIRSAWLHHRFVRIHPFEDGNGRVARGLTLLTLLSCNLAPLVVDRRERDKYIQCLDRANEADIRPLIRFFAELEIVALRSELERPALEIAGATGGGALAVLDAHIDRLRNLRGETGAKERKEKIEAIADSVHMRSVSWLESFANRIQERYSTIDDGARSFVNAGAPPDLKSRWWKRQLIRTARSVDFYANVSNGAWWAQLRLDVLGQRLRYLVFLQKVGHGETGVLTLTIFAEIIEDSGDEAQDTAEQIAISSPTESVTWTYSDEIDAHWDRVEELLDTSLAVVLDRFSASLN